MKTILLIAFTLICFYSSAQWTGAAFDTLTNNNVADETGPNSMAIDKLNNIHIVFRRENPVSGWDIFYRQRNATGWTSEILVNSLAGNNPAICASRTENEAYIVYEAIDSVDGDQEIFLCSSAGSNWNCQQLTNDTTEDVYPVIDVDSAGFVHVAWVGIDNSGNYKINYATNISGTWNEQTLSASNPGPFGSGASPQIAVESSGVAHIVFRAGNFSSYQIHHIYNLSPGGTAWSIDQLITPNQDDFLASIAVTNDSMVHMVVNGNGGFGFPWSSYYMTKTGANGVISPAQQVISGFNANLGNMFVDHDNVPHFIFNEVSGNLYTGNVIYADSTNWAGTTLLNTTDIFEASMVLDDQLNAYMLAYQGTALNLEEVIFYGPSSTVGLPEVASANSIFHAFSLWDKLNIRIKEPFTGTISCYSIDGKEVFMRNGNFSPTELISVDNLNAGLYIVKCGTESVMVNIE